MAEKKTEWKRKSKGVTVLKRIRSEGVGEKQTNKLNRKEKSKGVTMLKRGRRSERLVKKKKKTE